MNRKSIVLIAIFLTFLLHLTACVFNARTPFVQESSFEKSYKFSPGGKLRLKNMNGPIYITAWNKEEVRISAQKRIRASTQQMADKAIKRVKIKVDYHNRDMKISCTHPYSGKGKSFSGFLAGRNVGVKITYNLNVPKDIELRAETMNGNIEIKGVSGKSFINTMNGRLIINDTKGSLEADTMNGRIEAEILQASFKDEIDLKTMNGGIKLYLPEDIRANIRATTANGRISSDFAVLLKGSSSRKRLRGEINGGGAEISLETMNGSIKILKIF